MAITHKAFVSSTFEDLKEHRRYVLAALRKAGFYVDPMEDWTAATDEPSKFSQSRLEGCDLCILLVALRRGHVPQGEQRSITQLEFDAARTLGIDSLVFMLDENAPWPRKFDEMTKDSEIERWRSTLMESKGVSFFNVTPESVEIAPALTRWLRERSGDRRDEIRRTIADEVTQAVTSFVLAIQAAERHATSQESYDAAYHNWEVARPRIETRLRGNFNDPDLASRWCSLAEAVTALYRLSGTWSEPYRSHVLAELKSFFPESAADWDLLRHWQKKRTSNEDFQNYFGAWWKLREAALRQATDLSSSLVHPDTK